MDTDPTMDTDEPIYRTGYRLRSEIGGPITCATCGCRLDALPRGGYVHFGALGGRDARGCRVACVDAVHDASGRVDLLIVA
jgi:hypothetical protein